MYCFTSLPWVVYSLGLAIDSNKPQNDAIAAPILTLCVRRSPSSLYLHRIPPMNNITHSSQHYGSNMESREWQVAIIVSADYAQTAALSLKHEALQEGGICGQANTHFSSYSSQMAQPS